MSRFVVGWLASLLVTTLGSPVHGQVVFGISNGAGNPSSNLIYRIDPSNGDLSNINTVTLSGFSVERSLAMAARPSDGTLFAVIQTSADTTNNRRLVTIDPSTGIATNIGNLGRAFASLSFRSDGTLYGVVGDGGSTDPETLFTIDTSTAAITLQFALGNGADGESIAFHPNGLLYHSSGNAEAMFESVNVDTQNVTPLGQASGEMFAMGYHPVLGQLLGSDIGSQLFSINIANGARTAIGDMSDQLGTIDNRAIAFVAIPEPTTYFYLGAVVYLLGVRYYRRHGKQVQSSIPVPN